MNDTTKRFIQDMEEAGYDVFPYGGRNYFRGPAVRIKREDEQRVIRATSVYLAFDNMGRGLVAYPAMSDDEWYQEENRAYVEGDR